MNKIGSKLIFLLALTFHVSLAFSESGSYAAAKGCGFGYLSANGMTGDKHEGLYDTEADARCTKNSAIYIFELDQVFECKKIGADPHDRKGWIEIDLKPKPKKKGDWVELVSFCFVNDNPRRFEKVNSASDIDSIFKQLKSYLSTKPRIQFRDRKGFSLGISDKLLKNKSALYRSKSGRQVFLWHRGMEIADDDFEVRNEVYDVYLRDVAKTGDEEFFPLGRLSSDSLPPRLIETQNDGYPVGLLPEASMENSIHYLISLNPSKKTLGANNFQPYKQ